jgi:gluconolactonase
MGGAGGRGNPEDAAVGAEPRALDTRPAVVDTSTPSPRLDGGSPEVRSATLAVNPLAGVTAADVKRLGAGFIFTEGPLWLVDRKELLFSDLSDSKVWRFRPPGTFEVYRDLSNRTNGLAIDRAGRVLYCEEGQLTRGAYGAMPMPVLTGLRRPNDIIVRRDGTIYFTDRLANRVVRIARDDSSSTAAMVAGANGIMLSLDETILYVVERVAERVPQRILAFPVKADGTLGAPATFANTPGPVDGMARDVVGNVYATDPPARALRVYAPEGRVWGELPLPSSPSNLSFGDEDGRTLYITAGTELLSVRLGIPGVP